MTATLSIPAGEQGTVRLFALDLPPDEARALASDPSAVAIALGAPDLDPGRLDVFPVSRVAALGLSAYLAQGHGIPPEALAPDAARLDALEGHVAVVAAGAFGPEARTLTVAPPLRLLGAWQEELPRVTFGTLPSRGAEGTLDGAAAPSPAARRSGRTVQRILTVLILILAILGFILLNGGR